MPPHYLTKLFNPTSIAVFGASERPNSVGGTAFANLLAAGFQGKLYPINPKHAQIQGQACFASLEAVDEAIDLAVVATPAPTILSILHACGQKGIKHVVILSAGFEDAQGKMIQAQLAQVAHSYGMRLIGPNCLGIMRPSIGMNATFSKNQAKPGHIALVSQSGALCTAVLDWAEANDVGFSLVASTGDAADLDFGELLDYLATDPHTQSILLYIEGIAHARRFISGLKKAARMKPVILLKSGRMPEGTAAAVSHTGALVGADDVFNAAIERAGVVRALSISQLFSAAKVLSHKIRLKDNSLAILTNGGGPGVMATDRAAELGIKMPKPEAKTMDALNAVLPAHWSHGNPIDILGDATAERYTQALDLCLKDPQYDAVLVLLTPQAMTEPTEIAQAMVEQLKNQPNHKPVLTAWLGDTLVSEARQVFAKAGIPTFRTPEAAVEAMHFLMQYQQNQQLLMQVPEAMESVSPDVEGARLIIQHALTQKREILSATETRAVLRAFNIPITPAIEAKDGASALIAAESVGFPVAFKINSPDITHKSDSGGVKLNIIHATEVMGAFNELMETVKSRAPNARLDGVTVEPMAKMQQARELIVGVTRDPVFGPSISFGSGGTAVEVLKDSYTALPPLNEFIARKMIACTKVSKLLGNFRGQAAADMDAIVQVLMRVSDLVSELPEIQELDLNPLFATPDGVLAVDARIRVGRVSSAAKPYEHMAIHPYPSDRQKTITLPNGMAMLIRPIRPEDAHIEEAFVASLSEKTKYLRFMQSVQKLSREMLVRFTQIDYDSEMAFVALTQIKHETVELGVTRYTTNPDGQSCEFALVVRDDYQHQGIGARLLEMLIQHAQSRGLKVMMGEVLAENHGMLDLAKRFGFSVRPLVDDPGIVEVSLDL